MVDPEPILETLSVRQEYTKNGMPVLHSAPCTHIYTTCLDNSSTGMYLNVGRKLENTEGIHTYMGNICKETQHREFRIDPRSLVL